jgi:signal transduction histidine kinase
MWAPPRRFESDTQEQAFLADYSQRFASHRRVAAILGFLIDAIYIAWDYVYSAGDTAFAPVLDAVVLNRAITSLLVLPAIALSLTRRFEVDEIFASRCLVATMLVQFGLYCRGFIIAPYPYDYMYFFMGMFICLIYGFSMLRLRARPVLLLMLLALLMAAATFAWNWHIKYDALANHAARIYTWVAGSFLLSVATMGSVVSNLLERSERATFQRTAQLARSSQQTREKAQALIELQERMRREAERRNREKSQFLAAAVHDLKQPIQAIGNALEPGRWALERNDLASARRMFDLAAVATQLMRDQLTGVLEISRLESGFVRAEMSSFDLVPVVDQVCAQLRDQAGQDGVELTLQSADGPLIVYSDRHFIGRILQNLVANGIKYHDPAKAGQTRVTVTVRPHTAFLGVAVEDNGLGIAEEHLKDDAIFKPFFQANNRRRESEKGVGLGLSIVNAMLTLMPSHRLSVTSTTGVGTRFVLEVPWGGQISAAQPSPASPAATEADPAALVAAVRGVYVLYVEDDDLVRTSTCALFDAYGIAYECVDSLRQLQSALLRMDRPPDLLLTDYRLPEGETAVHVIKAVTHVFGSLPVLVVTGEVMEAEDLPGNWRLLHKPLSSPRLLGAIGEAMGHGGGAVSAAD